MADKIGIGITTTPNRAAHLKLCLKQVEQYLPDHAHVFINNDTTSDGIAKSKNNCLRGLKDCDYIFLLDDDCFPLQFGWTNFFIDLHKLTGQHHFNYLKRNHQLIETKENIGIYKECGGCFMFLTREVIEKVGGYYNEYGIYGFEHAGYSQRIYKSGLNTFGPYLCPDGANKYIYSLDLDLPRFDIKHHRSIPTRQAIKHIEENAKHFTEDLKEIYRGI